MTSNENLVLAADTLLHGSVYHYKILKVLGQGAFGVTYLASTSIKGPLGEVTVLVAIKEFFAKDLDSRHIDGTVTARTEGGIANKYAQAFRRESENLSKMKHPGIVSVLEAFEANGTYYYAMEFLPGGSLDEKVRGGGIPEEEAKVLIKTIGNSLSYMHNCKMMHLDLKPKNIMLKEDGTPVIIDFGLSKQFDEKGEPESSSTIGMGTPGYAPLEQANQTSGRSFQPTLDIYALGATLYKMLTGSTPPHATEILNDGFSEKELKDKSITENTIRAIKKAMSATRKDRPQSVSEFLNLLDDEDTEKTIVAGTSIGGQAPFPTPPPPPTPAPKPPHRGLWIALASGVAALSLALLLFLPKRGSSSSDILTVDGSVECMVEFEYVPSNREFEIEKNFNETWTFSGVPEWSKASVSNGKFNFSVTENKSKEDRTATVVFQKKGCKDNLAKLVITQKGITDRQWVAQPGSAHINSTPAGAQIWLDGKKTNMETPTVIEDLSVGRHSVKLVLEGYEDYTKTITITSGIQVELTQTMTLKKLPPQQASSQGQTGTVQSQSGSSGNSGSATTGSINGHDWVDLGLSVKWATCNVGASVPSDPGSFFAWGEIKSKSVFTWENYSHRLSGDSEENISFTKYTDTYRLDSSDDAAHAAFGGHWRMPTEFEKDELVNKCDWRWTSINGQNGYLVTSKKNKNSIFIPAAGKKENTDFYERGSSGYYWLISRNKSYPSDAWCLFFKLGEIRGYSCPRNNGFPIRPVLE